MIKKTFLLIFLILSQTLISQNILVTDFQEVKSRLIENKKELFANDQPENISTYIPIKIHISGTDEGEDRAKERDVLTMLCNLNENFKAVDIQFYLYEGFNYMDNTTLHEYNSNNHSNIQFANNRVDSVINMYIVKDMGSQQLFLKYDPTPERDWIVARRDKITDNPPIFIMKGLGSYFSLLPTYWCWNLTPTFNSTNDSIYCYNGNLEPIELQNGNNCEIAGDLICDTPPDYFFGNAWPNCVFTTAVADPNGDIVDPMEDNVMSSFNNCLAYQFTSEQSGVMQTDIQTRSNSNVMWQTLSIDYNFVPIQLNVSPTLIEPIEDVTTTYFDAVDFSWEAIPNANHYLFEIDEASNFSNNPKVLVVSNNSVSLTDLESGTKYYWRVTPYSKGSYCDLLTSESSFTTGLSVGLNNTITKPELDVSVLPSLFQTSFTLNFSLEKNEELKIDMFNVGGERVYGISNKKYTSGEHQVLVEGFGLPSGIYFVRIQTSDGVKTLRIVKL